MSNHENAEKHFELAVQLSRDALKALLLINAGSASALIALTDKTNASRDYTFAVMLFGAGAIASVLSYVFGYFSQLFYANHRFDVAQERDGSINYSRHRLFQALAIIGVTISIVLSIAGLCAALGAANS